MPGTVIDRLAAGSVGQPARVSDARLVGAVGHSPVGAFALGNQRLPVRIERVDFEPSRDGHAATGEGEVIRLASGDLHELIRAIKLQGLAKTGLAVRKRHRTRPVRRAMERMARVEQVAIKVPIGLQTVGNARCAGAGGPCHGQGVSFRGGDSAFHG